MTKFIKNNKDLNN
jgi:hypothetical protein